MPSWFVAELAQGTIIFTSKTTTWFYAVFAQPFRFSTRYEEAALADKGL
jgi:hypothetical protein